MLVAGGTGGHIYPSLSLINKMKNYTFVIITDQRGKEYFLSLSKKKNLIHQKNRGQILDRDGYILATTIQNNNLILQNLFSILQNNNLILQNVFPILHDLV